MIPELRFLQAHATHPHPELALELVWAQLASQGAHTMGATLGWCYLSEELASGANAILSGLQARMPHVAWVGGVGVGVLATGVEYLTEPALAVMLCNLPPSSFRVFHGRHPLPQAGAAGGWRAHTVQVHADPRTPDLPDLLRELAGRTTSGALFGGLSMDESHGMHLATDPDDDSVEPDAGVWHGGLSGVAFSDAVQVVSRVTQGCEPVGPRREVTASDRNIVYELDGLPALACLLHDLGVTAAVTEPGWQRDTLPKVRATLVGLTDADSELMDHRAHFGDDTRVRHLVGLDPSRQGIAVSEDVVKGMQLAFCQRRLQVARQDLIRICAEIREEFAPADGPSRRLAGAIYVSCSSRGGMHFGAPNAEMEIIAHALGDIPLIGFFASGEIARQHLYGYTGVLTVFAG
jgi:small ligand-binding sensory domain FIST